MQRNHLQEEANVNIQIFMGKKNFDCQKAERWFKERSMRYRPWTLPKGHQPP